MELRQIRFVLAVARCGAVRRAAASLNVDQAIISGKTRDLEAELGVKLFERHSGGVRLTGPGETFVSGAATALKALEDTASRVRIAGRGGSGALSLGYTGSIVAGPAQAVLAKQRMDAPDVQIILHEQRAGELTAGLIDRSLDLALIAGDAIPPRVERRELWTERLHFAIPHSLPMPAQRDWSLLSVHPVLAGASEDWAVYQRLIAQAGGPTVEPHRHDCSRGGVLGLVAAGAGIAIVPESALLIPVPGVSFLPIDGLAAYRVYAAWLRENGNPALARLVKLLKQT